MKKNVKRLLYLAAIAVVMLFSGCVFINMGGSVNGSDTITAKGERETYQIITGSFSKIKITGNCEIRYYAGNSDTVTLEVPPNVREYIEVSAENDTLNIKTTRRISYGRNRGPVLTVYAPSLSWITVEGAASLTAYDKIVSDSLTLTMQGAGDAKAELDVNNLTINIFGAGSFNLSGIAQTANISFSGAGDLNALSLQTADTSISMSGAGSIKISCSEKLRISADGVGSIEYRGSPNVSLNTSGFVKVKQVN